MCVVCMELSKSAGKLITVQPKMAIELEFICGCIELSAVPTLPEWKLIIEKLYLILDEIFCISFHRPKIMEQKKNNMRPLEFRNNFLHRNHSQK